MPSSARMVFIARDVRGRVVRSSFAIRPSLRQFAIAPGSAARVFAGDTGLKQANRGSVQSFSHIWLG